jgi:hypothetical protein
MQIAGSDAQCANADFPRLAVWHFASNVKLTRAEQYLKQDRPIIVTDEGIQIDLTDEHNSKADSGRFEMLQ